MEAVCFSIISFTCCCLHVEVKHVEFTCTGARHVNKTTCRRFFSCRVCFCSWTGGGAGAGGNQEDGCSPALSPAGGGGGGRCGGGYRLLHQRCFLERKERRRSDFCPSDFGVTQEHLSSSSSFTANTHFRLVTLDFNTPYSSSITGAQTCTNRRGSEHHVVGAAETNNSDPHVGGGIIRESLISPLPSTVRLFLSVSSAGEPENSSI